MMFFVCVFVCQELEIEYWWIVSIKIRFGTPCKPEERDVLRGIKEKVVF
jgi:hypothetical protein